MNILIYIIAGLSVGAAIGLVIINRKMFLEQSCCALYTDEGQGIVKDQGEEKEKNLQKIREFLANKETVKNEQIQNLLGVSDATVARYFNDLEKEGIIKQAGDAGRGVYYEIVK